MLYMNKLSKYSELLNLVEVKTILNSMLESYKLESIKKISDNEIVCGFSNKKAEIMTLTIFGKDLIFEKDGKNKKEITRIILGPDENKNPIIKKFICEKRDRGVIITEINEYYGWTRFTDQEKLPTDLYEYRYVFGNDNLKTIYDHKTPIQFELINKNNINLINYDLANFKTDFEVHMRNYYAFGLRPVVDSATPTKVFFNGKDVSYCYDLIDGPNKISVVHDLYNGIINNNDRDAIRGLSYGFMTTDGFDLRSFLGFTDKENAFLGDPLEPTQEYQDMVRNILKYEVGYNGEIKFDRDSLLNCICYVLSGTEMSKLFVEETLGIPYNEFEKLDEDEQQKIIESRANKKRKRKFLDRIFKKNNK